jgi:integrase/recombinase XerD
MNPGNFILESQKCDIFPQSGTKLGQFSVGHVTPAEAATLLGVSKKTVLRWCESGRLPAIPKQYGDKFSYQISIQALSLFQMVQNQPVKVGRPKTKAPEPVKIKESKPHSSFIPAWEKAMTTGLMTGRPFSIHTIIQYRVYAEKFLAQYGNLSIENLKAELLNIPVEQFGRKDKFYKAMVCFGKFLIEEKALDASFLEDIKKYRPKRHKPPRRTSVDETQLNGLLEACETSLERALVVLLSATGLRASECAALLLDDLDFQKQCLVVRLGKGNKTRRVGLHATVIEALQAYLKERPQVAFDTLFLNQLNQPIDRHGIRQRLERIGKKAGVDVSPHALRRAFVTINANKGRSLVMLQIACGHSDIKTTRAYCQTTEDEVIQAMKDWS